MTITNTNRDNSLDILRIVACMMVIMMHSPCLWLREKAPAWCDFLFDGTV